MNTMTPKIMICATTKQATGPATGPAALRIAFKAIKPINGNNTNTNIKKMKFFILESPAN